MDKRITERVFSEEEGRIVLHCNLRLPEELREELRRPLGEPAECRQLADSLRGKDIRLITVGDSVSADLIEYGLSPSLIIWDAKTERSPCDRDSISLLEGYAPARRVGNPAGTITMEAWDAVTGSLAEERASIFVEGEEDLLAIPAILNSRDGTHVIYGSPGRGAILIVVNRKIRAVFLDILSRFKNENRDH